MRVSRPLAHTCARIAAIAWRSVSENRTKTLEVNNGSEEMITSEL